MREGASPAPQMPAKAEAGSGASGVSRGYEATQRIAQNGPNEHARACMAARHLATVHQLAARR